MTNLFRKDQRATALGLFVAGGISSNVLLNLAGPFLVGTLGWRGLLLVFGVAGLLVTVALFFLGNEAHPDPNVEPPRFRDVPMLLRHPIVLLTGVIQFCRLAIVSGLTFWLPSVLIDDNGYSLAVAGIVVAISAFVIAPSNIMGGIISDRIRRPLLIMGVSFVAITITTTLLTATTNLPLVILIVIVNSIFVQLYFGPLFALPLPFFKPSNAGLLSGMGNLFANIGGLVSTLVLGVIKDATGSFDAAILCLSGVAVLGLIATLTIRFLPATQPPSSPMEQGPTRLGIVDAAPGVSEVVPGGLE
jgi:nitrate/nitrite transporter NarK